MNRIFYLTCLAVALLALRADATTPTLTSISQPLYFLGSAGDATIQIIKTPKILNNSSAMFWVNLFSSPTELPGSGGDLNLISIYGLSIDLVAQDEDGRVTEVSVDISKAKRPERYPFSLNEVTDATIKSIRSEFPDRSVTKIVIRHSEESLDAENSEGESDAAGDP